MKKLLSNVIPAGNKSVFRLSRIRDALRWRLRRLYNIIVYGRKSPIPCNICHGRIFIRGPNGRLSSTGKLPWCPKCWSLERHRGLREFWNRFPRDYVSQLDALQFSNDPAVDRTFFRSHTVSIYGGSNSLDLQEIDLADASYDVVLCNQVLEHVRDDRKSLLEMMRITKNDGFVQIGVPSPMTLEKTEDWGHPQKSDHGHYRNYGRDISRMFDQLIGAEKWREYIITDPVTKSQDCIFLLCHSTEALNRINDLLRDEN